MKIKFTFPFISKFEEQLCRYFQPEQNHWTGIYLYVYYYVRIIYEISSKLIAIITVPVFLLKYSIASVFAAVMQ